jgi:transposase
MDLKYARCCGLDVHSATVVACCREVVDGTVRKETKVFGTTLRELSQLCDWLRERDCPIAAMESTGVYWRPVYNVLCKRLKVIVGNARAMKPPTGKKTDKADAGWIADLLAHDLIRPSFIPEPGLKALREFNRLRVRLVEQRTQAKNRIQGQLQDANIKLANVASDVFGKSGRKMLDALVAGERDPAVLAQFSCSTLRRKIPQLELALEGSFSAHHATILGHLLEQHDLLDKHVHKLNEQIRQATTELGMDGALAQIITIPGINEVSGRQILSEIGNDMSHFGLDKRLASWATACPGNNETAGKRRSGRTRKGNRYLRRILVECAHATEKTQTQLGRIYRRFKARIGANKAAMAVGHKMLIIIFHVLREGTFYDDSKLANDAKEDERRRRRALRDLERLGYKVTIEKDVA